MPQRMSPFVPAILTTVLLATVALIAPSRGAAPTAEECLKAPNSDAPSGTHWYYRINRATHRQCWYLGPNDAKVRAAASRKAHGSVKAAAPPAPEETQAEPPVVSVATTTVRPPESTGFDGARDSAFFMRWPDKAKPAVPLVREAAPPSNSFADEQAQTAAEPAEMPTAWPVAAMPEAAPASDQTVAPSIRSEQMIAALAGALGLAGIVGHLLYRGATSRGRRYRDRFERWEAAAEAPGARGSILPVLAAANAAESLDAIARQVPLAPRGLDDGRERPEWCEPEERRAMAAVRRAMEAVDREMAERDEAVEADDAPRGVEEWLDDVEEAPRDVEQEQRDVEAKLQQLLHDWKRVAA